MKIDICGDPHSLYEYSMIIWSSEFYMYPTETYSKVKLVDDVIRISFINEYHARIIMNRPYTSFTIPCDTKEELHRLYMQFCDLFDSSEICGMFHCDLIAQEKLLSHGISKNHIRYDTGTYFSIIISTTQLHNKEIMDIASKVFGNKVKCISITKHLTKVHFTNSVTDKDIQYFNVLLLLIDTNMIIKIDRVYINVKQYTNEEVMFAKLLLTFFNE